MALQGLADQILLASVEDLRRLVRWSRRDTSNPDRIRGQAIADLSRDDLEEEAFWTLGPYRDHGMY